MIIKIYPLSSIIGLCLLFIGCEEPQSSKEPFPITDVNFDYLQGSNKLFVSAMVNNTYMNTSLDSVEVLWKGVDQQNTSDTLKLFDDGTLNAENKNIVVIGGGDTGSDCIGTSIRQGALSVTQLEIMPEPPQKEEKLLTWPNWPLIMRTSSSQEEGAEREFAVMTTRFEGVDGKLRNLHCVKVDKDFNQITGTEFILKCDLCVLEG